MNSIKKYRVEFTEKELTSLVGYGFKNKTIVFYLAELGINILNLPYEAITYKDEDGNTPLHIYCCMCSILKDKYKLLDKIARLPKNILLTENFEKENIYFMMASIGYHKALSFSKDILSLQNIRRETPLHALAHHYDKILYRKLYEMPTELLSMRANDGLSVIDTMSKFYYLKNNETLLPGQLSNDIVNEEVKRLVYMD